MYQTQERPQTSSGYKDQLRAQLRDNYVQNRSERSSKASQSGAASRQEAVHYPVDAVSQHSASSHRQRATAGPQVTRDIAPVGRRVFDPARSTHSGASQHGAKTPQQATWGNPRGTASQHGDHEAKSQKSQQSNSTTLTNAELVCDNCINRDMADERRTAGKHERLHDQQIQNELIARERALREKEEAEEARRKEQFRQEATAHWEDSKRAKQLQKEEERKRDEALRALYSDGKAAEQEIKALAEKRRQQLRNDLKAQIDERKAIQEQTNQDQTQLSNLGLPIGAEYVNRYDRYRDAHQAALKEQIDEKQNE